MHHDEHSSTHARTQRIETGCLTYILIMYSSNKSFIQLCQSAIVQMY